MNELLRHNEARRRELIRLRDIVKRRRDDSSLPHVDDYPLARLHQRVTRALIEHIGGHDMLWEIDLLDRSKFDADFAVRLTGLLKDKGAKEYISSYVPRIVQALQAPALHDMVSYVSSKGIYVNVKLSDTWFLSAIQFIAGLDDRFGQNDTRAGRTQIVDYSSPNVAKVLHAGHFRSTMIGHVLSNLYAACGALVYRVNHINDFGGFGFMLEGFHRFEQFFPPSLTDNELLLEIYAIRRTIERVIASDELLDTDDQARAVLARYFPAVTTPDELRAAYEDFVSSSNDRFKKLEDGDPEEVALWQRMVQWSLDDFKAFYEALDIHIDFLIGESFYVNAGNALVDEAIRTGKAFELTKERVYEAALELDRAAATGEITPQARDKSVALLEKDLGAIVVPLPDGERLVVRRSDGRSIYATRDLGAIKVRNEIFDPTDVNYVVGQEQRVHFSRLFQAAQVLGLATATKPILKHTYFGFYVDADTGKKLSSRESVAGVTELLTAAVKHFRDKSAEDGTMTAEEIDLAAQQLAVGSVIFNDLKRDMKGSVSIPRGDVAPIIAAFEKSGGPYVVYSACRARAILQKYNRPLPDVSEITTFDVSDQEALLILRILEFPEKVIRATNEDNPSVLVRHLLDIASLYNPYYVSAPVLQGNQGNKFRLLITRAVQLVLTNGLDLCHVKCPPKI